MTGDPYLTDMSGLQVPAADPDGPGELEVTVLVNVPKNASSSTVGTRVRLTGRDILNKLVVKDLTLPVAISTYVPEPDIRVLSILATQVEPGKEFDLTLQLINAGDGYLSELELVLLSNSSKVSIKDPYRKVSDLPPSAIETVTFTCVADASMLEGETSLLYLMPQYNDSVGQLHIYSEGEPIPLMVSSVPPKEKEERTDGLVYIMIGLIVSTALISLALVASTLIVMVLRRTPKRNGPVDAGNEKREDSKDQTPKEENSPGPSNVPGTSSPSPAYSPPISPLTEGPLPPAKSDQNKPFRALDDLFDNPSL
jgi:hypothetical protein